MPAAAPVLGRRRDDGERSGGGNRRVFGYASLYAHFATLVRGAPSMWTRPPLQLAADAFLCVDASRSSRSSSDAGT